MTGAKNNPCVQPSAWDKVPVPDDLPVPSARYQQLYKQYADEMKQSFRTHTDPSKVSEVHIMIIIIIVDIYIAPTHRLKARDTRIALQCRQENMDIEMCFEQFHIYKTSS